MEIRSLTATTRFRAAIWIIAGALAAGLAGCDQRPKTGDGPAEKAGQNIDAAAAKAGQALNQAAEKTGEGLQHLGEKLQQSAEDAQKKKE